MCHFSVYLRSSFTVQYATALYVAFAMQQIMVHVKMFFMNIAVNNFLILNNPFIPMRIGLNILQYVDGVSASIL